MCILFICTARWSDCVFLCMIDEAAEGPESEKERRASRPRNDGDCDGGGDDDDDDNRPRYVQRSDMQCQTEHAI